MSISVRIPNGAHYCMTDSDGRIRYYRIDDSGVLRYYSKVGAWLTSKLNYKSNHFALEYLIEKCKPIEDKK